MFKAGIPQTVMDIYESARNAPSIEEAIEALGKARDLPKMEKAIFAANLGEFNKAAKKNAISFVEILDRKEMSFRVVYTEKPMP